MLCVVEMADGVFREGLPGSKIGEEGRYREGLRPLSVLCKSVGCPLAVKI